MSLKAKMRQTVEEIIYELSPEDIVEVHWADASKNTNVKRIDNDTIKCYKKQVGRYKGIMVEQSYGMEHLVLEGLDDEDPSRPTVYSIPLPCVVHVIVIGNKPLKMTSDVGLTYLCGNNPRVVGVEDGVGTKQP